MSNLSLHKRVEKFKQIVQYGNISSEACLDQIRKNVTSHIFVQRRIGSSSINGEAYLGKAFPCENIGTCYPLDLSVKLIPVKPDEWVHVRDHRHNPEAWRKGLWAELLFMQICSYVIKQSKIPNLPMAYSYMMCRNCQYENPILKQVLPKGTPCLLLLNEFANEGDFATWVKSSRNLSQWSMAYFQIFVGLYFLQKFFNITHHDMHWGNVLVHTGPGMGYSAYKIDGNIYYVPNHGYEFVLWDFGYARIPNKVEISALAEYYADPQYGQQPRLLVDYFRIASVPSWLKDPKVLAETPAYADVHVPEEMYTQFLPKVTKMFKEGYTLKSVIPKLWGIYMQKPEGILITDKYDLDSPFKNFPKEHAFLLHNFVTDPIPERIPHSKDLAEMNTALYSKHGHSLIRSKDGEVVIEKSHRDYEDYDPMDID